MKDMEDMTPQCHIHTLPMPAFARVVGNLQPVDIAGLALACKEMHKMLSPANADVYHAMAVLRFGKVTDINQWIATCDPPTPTYRDLYFSLCLCESAIGLWSPISGGSPTAQPPCFYNFAWCRDCVQCYTVQHTTATPLLTLGAMCWKPTRGHAMLEILNETQIVLTEARSGWINDATASPQAEAVTAVALRGVDTDAVLGTSPAGSFAHEMAQFMQGQVRGGGRVRRGKRLGRASSTGSLLDTMHHLFRVTQPVPD